MPDPLYTPNNCEAAYQLLWSYTLFWRVTVVAGDWFETLKQQTEQDGIRLLEYENRPPNVTQFLVSTRPPLAPVVIAQRVKGRLQHLLRGRDPAAFRRNYSLRSIGSTRREKLDQYLASQCSHHPMADERVTRRLVERQIHRPEIDLSQPRKTAHALYWHNLHLVIVHEGRCMETRQEALDRLHTMLPRIADKKGNLLARAAILPYHLHLTLGCGLEESPESVALAYMNNLAYALGMKRVFQFSYYVGTFGEYDVGVIPRG